MSSVTGTYNGSSGSGSFTCDANGNAISDGLRGLTSINYFDELNLPKQYYKDASNKVDYTYDAGGLKWGKTATTAGTATATLYYGAFIYESGSLTKVLTSDGFYDPVTSLYHYYLKDHLGNNRVTFHYSGTTAVVDQEVEYYPFGSLFTEDNLEDNAYLYNGKELNNEFFENYDYGARFYDAVLGRWHTIDPLSEKFYNVSSYSYVENNPLLYIDPDGQDKWKFHIDIKLTSGKIGGKFNIMGLKGSGNYSKGGAEQKLQVYVEYDTNTGTIKAGASHIQTQIEEEGFLEAGPFGGGESSTKDIVTDINTKDGGSFTEEKTFTKTESGNVGPVSVEESSEDVNVSTDFGVSAEANALVLGVGASVNLEVTLDDDVSEIKSE